MKTRLNKLGVPAYITSGLAYYLDGRDALADGKWLPRVGTAVYDSYGGSASPVPHSDDKKGYVCDTANDFFQCFALGDDFPVRKNASYTIEVVSRIITKSNMGNRLYFFGARTPGEDSVFMRDAPSGGEFSADFWNYNTHLSRVPVKPTEGTLDTRTAVCPGDGYFMSYFNGIAGVSSNKATPNYGQESYLGYGWPWGGQDRSAHSVIYAMRIYNRVLSQDEINHNHRLDLINFGE